jgi:hypothetical protein
MPVSSQTRPAPPRAKLRGAHREQMKRWSSIPSNFATVLTMNPFTGNQPNRGRYLWSFAWGRKQRGNPNEETIVCACCRWTGSRACMFCEYRIGRPARRRHRAAERGGEHHRHGAVARRRLARRTGLARRLRAGLARRLAWSGLGLGRGRSWCRCRRGRRCRDCRSSGRLRRSAAGGLRSASSGLLRAAYGPGYGGPPVALPPK